MAGFLSDYIYWSKGGVKGRKVLTTAQKDSIAKYYARAVRQDINAAIKRVGKSALDGSQGVLFGHNRSYTKYDLLRLAPIDKTTVGKKYNVIIEGDDKLKFVKKVATAYKQGNYKAKVQDEKLYAWKTVPKK